MSDSLTATATADTDHSPLPPKPHSAIEEVASTSDSRTQQQYPCAARSFPASPRRFAETSGAAPVRRSSDALLSSCPPHPVLLVKQPTVSSDNDTSPTAPLLPNTAVPESAPEQTDATVDEDDDGDEDEEDVEDDETAEEAECGPEQEAEQEPDIVPNPEPLIVPEPVFAHELDADLEPVVVPPPPGDPYPEYATEVFGRLRLRQTQHPRDWCLRVVSSKYAFISSYKYVVISLRIIAADAPFVLSIFSCCCVRVCE